MTSEEIRSKLHTLRTNPAATQRYVIDLLAELSDNQYVLKEPSNPLVFLLEASALMSVAAMDQFEAISRKLYPALAVTPEDLYRHMADHDYYDCYALPAKGVISFVFLKRELLALAVDVPGQPFRKLTLPRETTIQAMDTPLGFYYPIDIRVLNDSGLQVVYDVSQSHPLHALEDSHITWYPFVIAAEEYVLIEVPVAQFLLSSFTLPLNLNTALVKELSFVDQFYAVRVFHTIDQKWVEIKTTHSDEVFDTAEPYALVRLLGNTVRVTIPIIYFTEQLMGQQLRVDIYSTKGAYPMDMGLLTEESYNVKWRDLALGTKSLYSAPLGQLSVLTTFSATPLTGGRPGLDFEALRKKVIQARMARDYPISFSELQVFLEQRGYSLIRSVDNVSDRVLLASKALPPLGDTLSPIGVLVAKVAFDNQSLTSQDVISVQQSYTLLPDHLYELVGHQVHRLSDDQHNEIMALPPLQLLELTGQRKLLYVPLHYVLNERDNTLTTTPYLLTHPHITYRRLLKENIVSDLRMSSNILGIEIQKDRWVMNVSVSCSESVMALPDAQVHAQLSFVPYQENSAVFLNGIMIGRKDGERIFSFELRSYFDIDRENYLRLMGFSMHENETLDYRVSLSDTYRLTFCVSGIDENVEMTGLTLKTDILGRHLLPQSAKALTVEELGLELGQEMSLLVSDSRMTVSEQDYQTYQTDVPDVYEENIYQRDEKGHLVLTQNEATGRYAPIIVHRTGEAKLDTNGKPIIKHQKGEIKLVNGAPVPSQDRGPLRIVDMLLLDAQYLFTQREEQVQYRKNIPSLLGLYLHQDLGDIQKRLLEQTRLLFQPKSSMGQISIRLSETQTRLVDSDQALRVNYHLPPKAFNDDALREALIASTRQVVLLWLDQSTLSLSVLSKRLTEAAGEDILGLNVAWLGSLANVDLITLVNPESALSLSQVLAMDFDNTLYIEDALIVEFEEHS